VSWSRGRGRIWLRLPTAVGRIVSAGVGAAYVTDVLSMHGVSSAFIGTAACNRCGTVHVYACTCADVASSFWRLRCRQAAHACGAQQLLLPLAKLNKLRRSGCCLLFELRKCNTEKPHVLLRALSSLNDTPSEFALRPSSESQTASDAAQALCGDRSRLANIIRITDHRRCKTLKRLHQDYEQPAVCQTANTSCAACKCMLKH
jgi:hypothetical protein